MSIRREACHIPDDGWWMIEYELTPDEEYQLSLAEKLSAARGGCNADYMLPELENLVCGLTTERYKFLYMLEKVDSGNLVMI